jgi:hypothetical protein
MQISDEKITEHHGIHQKLTSGEISRALGLNKIKEIEKFSQHRISKEKREKLNAYARYLYSIYQKRKESLNKNK